MNVDYILNPDKYHVVPPRLDGENDEHYKLRLQAYSMGMQSQQAKIDELQEQLRIERERGTEYFTDFHGAIAERNELQGRIDSIVDLVRNNTPDYYLDNMIEEIIKGKEDEN